MKVCGVIAEYDPFHRGHERHLALARERTGARYVLCLMSGSFTQRGMPALLPPHLRAEMALRCGADAVLQLPYAFSVREADMFAFGGVSILQALGCVTHLSFGCETDDLALLQKAARALEAPSDAFSRALQGGLARGLSFAAAQGRALEAEMGLSAGLFNAPNTALALAYLRALLKLNSPIQPAPVLRRDSYRAAELAPYPSAGAVRGAILRGDWAGVREGVPPQALPVLEKAVLDGLLCPPGGLDGILRHALLSSDPAAVSRWPGIDEGLEMRLLSAAGRAVSREEIIALTKSRRYTWGRISRALCHGVMGLSKADLPAAPAYARVLGFRESARPLLRRMQKSGFPLLTRPARAPWAALDAKADELWRIGAGLPLGDTYRRPPVILP